MLFLEPQKASPWLSGAITPGGRDRPTVDAEHDGQKRGEPPRDRDTRHGLTCSNVLGHDHRERGVDGRQDRAAVNGLRDTTGDGAPMPRHGRRSSPTTKAAGSDAERCLSSTETVDARDHPRFAVR